MYYFVVALGHAWSRDPVSYAGGSISTGKASLPDRSKVMNQTETDNLVLEVEG
jgi:hypothetical protein